jgi:hypothetical protein
MDKAKRVVIVGMLTDLRLSALILIILQVRVLAALRALLALRKLVCT